ncbi:nucleotide sugar dehydrogenase [Erysipelothrix anatis]|uniref:nucleotide sugar dehydrogenase n=1 Tax=Erysipelothrix anatis TaxID=2683713 RepID=UPI00135A7F98|nr:nucleotide sugar dehydrogenase [Erysipelothrix anatis]
MKINVIGLGYIGLPTSLILASNNNDVFGTDTNEEIVTTLKNGNVTFEEEGLIDIYNSAIKNGFDVGTKAVKADLYIITVPTPYVKETKIIDPKYLISATQDVIEFSEDGAILVVESTVSPGVIDKHVRPIVESSNKKIHIVHAPERILPGAMINELITNSRTIGADLYEIGEKVKEVYESFCEGEIVITDIRTAEMSKVVENTFRDINIAFSNELAKISRESGLDVYEVIRIANKHPRVNILQPGPGVGGHCISVDPWFLVGDYPELTELIHQARKTNDGMPAYVKERIKDIMIENKISDFAEVGVYGLTYKENVDDVRESPALQLYEILSNQEKRMRFYDPFITKEIVSNQKFTFEEFISDLKLVVVLVAHNDLKTKDFSQVAVFDTKNAIKDKKTYKL